MCRKQRPHDKHRWLSSSRKTGNYFPVLHICNLVHVICCQTSALLDISASPVPFSLIIKSYRFGQNNLVYLNSENNFAAMFLSPPYLRVCRYWLSPRIYGRWLSWRWNPAIEKALNFICWYSHIGLLTRFHQFWSGKFNVWVCKWRNLGSSVQRTYQSLLELS